MPKRRERRACELLCEQCRIWKHFSHFRLTDTGHGSVPRYRRLCKICEQTNRDRIKNSDRPTTIIENRTKDWATKLGCPKEFLWSNMNWRALVPLLRALMTNEGLCLSCGHPFRGERDIQIEHQAPPRQRDDWARHHARNLSLSCGSCNNGKGDTPYEEWLDGQEQNRLSVVAINQAEQVTYQLPLFQGAS